VIKSCKEPIVRLSETSEIPAKSYKTSYCTAKSKLLETTTAISSVCSRAILCVSFVPVNNRVGKIAHISFFWETFSSHFDIPPRGGGGVLPCIPYTGMCRPTESWFWSSWFTTGYPFQKRFLERGIKNCGSRLYLLLKIVADYEEAFIWCISRTHKEISLKKRQGYFNLQTF